MFSHWEREQDSFPSWKAELNSWWQQTGDRRKHRALQNQDSKCNAGFKRLIYLSFNKSIPNLHLCLFTDGAKPDCPAGTITDGITESSPLIPMRSQRSFWKAGAGQSPAGLILYFINTSRKLSSCFEPTKPKISLWPRLGINSTQVSSRKIHATWFHLSTSTVGIHWGWGSKLNLSTNSSTPGAGKKHEKKCYLPVTAQFFAATAAGGCKKNQTEEAVIRGGYEIKTSKEYI